MLLTKTETIEKLCALTSKVGKIIYHDSLPHDCFCKNTGNESGITVDDAVTYFIEEAVNEKIKRIVEGVYGTKSSRKSSNRSKAKA